MSQGMLGNLSLSETQGPRRDLENKLASPKGRMWFRRLKRFLRGENPFGVPKTFEVTTDGRNCKQFITDLEAQGDPVDATAKQLLRNNKKFVATNGVTYKLALVMGDEFEDDKRTTSNIRAEAVKRGYVDPSMELAPYVCEMFFDEDLKQIKLLALIIMHEAVANSVCRPSLLGLRNIGSGCSLATFCGDPYFAWRRDIGFLFLIPVNN